MILIVPLFNLTAIRKSCYYFSIIDLTKGLDEDD